MLYDISTYRLVRTKVADDAFIEKHKHGAYFHYIYILNGAGTVNVGGHHLDAAKYDLFMIPPNVEHETFGKSDLIKLDIKFMCGEPFYTPLLDCGYYIHGISAYEDRLLRDIFDEAVNKKPMYSYAIDNKLGEFLCMVLRREKRGIEMVSQSRNLFDIVPGTGDEPSCKLDSAVNYIRQNINKNISVKELSEYMGYSESYFSTSFKKHYGYSPNRYVNILKVEHAKELIMYSSLSITAIAEELGFESVHYFSKVFKQITGLSPLNYVDRSSIDMIINVIKNAPSLPPEDRYEIPARPISEYRA